MTGDANERSYSVAAVAKALRVLDVFAIAPHRFSLTEVAARAGVSSNQAFRLLQTLVAAGYVQREVESKLYRVGPRVFGLVGALFHGDPLVVAADEVLTLAHERTGETVAVIAADGDETICVDVRESAHPLLVATSVGSRSNFLHAGAVGKLMLAARDDAAVDRYLTSAAPLRQFTRWTPVTPEAVWAELQRVRRDGYAVSDEEVAEGMYGIAAPVRDRRGEVVAAITLSAPVTRAGAAERELHRRVVVDAGRRISDNLGWRPDGPVNS